MSRFAVASASKKFRRAPSGSTPVGDPYPLYTSFDRNTVPWHTASGGYGASVPLQSPTLPATTRSVTVNTRGDFNTEAAVSGTQITIGTGWAASSGVATVNASDIDIIIPSGISIGCIEFGAFPRTTAIARVRVRGSTPGSHSGGRMGQLKALPGTAGIYTDVVVDGIDLNGDSSFSTTETNTSFRCDVVRMAVLNSRVIAAGPTWLGGTSHLFIGNSNFYSGAATRAQVGYDEGWAIRCNRGPITIVDSRIQSTRYATLRPQSIGNSGELFYIGGSSVVSVAEGRTAWVWNNLGLTSTTGQGGLIENCNIYSHTATGCGFGEEIATPNVDWAEIKNNDFYGAGNAVFTQGYIDAAVKGGGVGTGNTFNTLTSVPAWGGPGDPTAVPLPAGLTLIDGEGVCPAGP